MKEPIIYLISGKARHGKTTLGNYIANFYNKKNIKTINTPVAKYLKYYAKDIIGWENDDNNKPRLFLQEIGNLIRFNLNKRNMLIDRIIEDIEIYSYYANIIIIDDIRLEEEINKIKDKYQKVVLINIYRPNFTSNLTNDEQKDITETNLDNYQNYDYKIINNELEELMQKANEICMEVQNKWIK